METFIIKLEPRLTEAELVELNAAVDLTQWCECDKDFGVVFFDDNSHPLLEKHHYRCKRCSGVTQIG